MRKIVISIFVFLFLLGFSPSIFAQEDQRLLNEYVITDYSVNVEIQKDTSLLVTEVITLNFPYKRHGIYRIIPVIYSYKGKTIKADLSDVEVVDGSGRPVMYKKSRVGQSVSLKIGDPNQSVSGVQTYVINYKITNILQRYEDRVELYWNVTGSNWDTEILDSKARVISNFARIEKADCFAGEFGGSERFCEVKLSYSQADFTSTTKLGSGRDFTLVVALNKENELLFPTKLQIFLATIFDNWGYFVSPLSFIILFSVWLKRGRDKRFSSDTIYYRPDDKKEKDVGVFERKFLPLVYHPIKGLSPAEVGTIIDEKVDIEDVIAEILELARIGFIKIQKIEKKKLLKDEIDYAFIKTEKFDDNTERSKLRDYQEYLLRELFRATAVQKSIKTAEKLFKGHDSMLDKVWRMMANKDYVLLTGLKNHFYEGLLVLKKKLYKRMEDETIFHENPETVRGKWAVITLILDIVILAILINFLSTTANFGPIISFVFFGVVSFFFALSMPQRTAWGYSLMRQITGLRWYLEKGKWRHEISEKHLFIEEILPLAVSLGVVDQLSKDMRDLALAPPRYFAGATMSSFASDLGEFRTTTSSSLLSAPTERWSGASSWSGGSGFGGGGFSGGGFCGGGGSSW